MAECPSCAKARPEDASPCPHCGAPSPHVDDLIGREVLGRYQIVRLLAEGGMGRVYVAEQAVGTARRRVAVKVVRPQRGSDPQLVSRFAREAETLVKLTHPNTVHLFDFGTLEDGTLALAMEYVEGSSLARVLRSEGRLAPARAELILAQICGALAEAHAAGIVHRDLKPDNVLLVARAGQADFVKVVDFGIAKVAGDAEGAQHALTQHGMMIGTPPYMSPEQFSGGGVDARSDIYALGLIAYEMLTGDLPFAAKTPWEWASKHLTAEPRPLEGSGIPAQYAAAIRCALAKNASERPESVSAFLAMFTGTSPARAVAYQPFAPQDAPLAESVTLPRMGARRTAIYAGLGAGVALAGLLLARSLLGAPGVPSLPAAPIQVAATPAVGATIGASPQADLVTDAAAQDAKQPASVMTDSPAHAAHRTPRWRAADAATGRPIAPPPQPTPDALGAKASAKSANALSSEITALPEGEPPPSAKARATAPSSQSSSGDSADLRQRVDAIRQALPERVEQAVGLYQAATSRYPKAPELRAVRDALAASGAARLGALGTAGRCAQAGALHRALASIGAAPSGPGAVGPCPPR